MPGGKRKKAKKKAVAEAVDQSPKDIGNAAFLCKDFAKAVEHYGKAIEEDAENHILYSNRSAAFMGIGTEEAFKSALTDAETCLAKNPTWPKGFLRKASGGLIFLRRGIAIRKRCAQKDLRGRVEGSCRSAHQGAKSPWGNL